MRLEGRIAVVTGAAQGMGWAIAHRLAEEGAMVALLDRDGDRAAAAAAQLRSASAWSCDVQHRAQVQAVVGQIQTALGPVDLLINNAGIWRHTPVLEVDESVWDDVFSVNVKGILFCSQAAAPGMIQRQSGKIINIASTAGFGGSADWSAYCASKAAAISLTLGLAEALGPQHVQVNAICPGATRTPMLDYIQRTEPGSRFDEVHRPEEVAEEVMKLVVPFDQATHGCIIAMKPAGSVLGISVQG